MEMLETRALIAVKARLLLAAEMAARIGAGEELELEREVFAVVMDAMSHMPADARMVLAELDILRGMVTGSFDSLLLGETHGRSRPVERVQQEASVGGSEGERHDHTETGGAVRPDGPDGKDTVRPRPRRNRRRNSGDTKPVES